MKFWIQIKKTFLNNIEQLDFVLFWISIKQWITHDC